MGYSADKVLAEGLCASARVLVMTGTSLHRLVAPALSGSDVASDLQNVVDVLEGQLTVLRDWQRLAAAAPPVDVEPGE